MSAQPAEQDPYCGNGYYRIRTPDRYGGKGTAVTYRVSRGVGCNYLSVGSSTRRFSLSEEEAWAIWAVLNSGLKSGGGRRPQWVKTSIEPS